MNVKIAGLTWLGVLCAGAMGWAGVLGTPFEDLADEVDARRAQLSDPEGRVERQQRKALQFTTRELKRAGRGLKRDLRSAQRVTARLERQFPDDALFDAALGGMLDQFAGELANRLFNAEEQLDAQTDALRRYRAGQLLRQARDAETGAAAAATSGELRRRAKLLRHVGSLVVAAEAAISYEPPVVVEPTGDPVGGVIARLDATVDGRTMATNTVDAWWISSPNDMSIHVEAQPNDQRLTSIALDWTWRNSTSGYRASFSDAADTGTVVIRRGGITYDRQTSGEVLINGGHATSLTGYASLRGSYRVSASDAFGNQVTVTGSFDISSMPFTATWID